MTRQVNGHLGTFASIEALTAKFPPSESIGCSANVGTAIPYTKAWCDGSEWALVQAPQIQALVSGAGDFTALATALIAPGDGKTLTTTVGANATLDASGTEIIDGEEWRWYTISATNTTGNYVEVNVPVFAPITADSTAIRGASTASA